MLRPGSQWARLPVAGGGELVLTREGPASRSSWQLEHRSASGELLRRIPLGIRPAADALSWAELERLALAAVPEFAAQAARPELARYTLTGRRCPACRQGNEYRDGLTGRRFCVPRAVREYEFAQPGPCNWESLDPEEKREPGT